MIFETNDDTLPAVITCIDCGGRCHLLTTVTFDQPLYPGDVATYRCEDCRDRWDLVVPGEDGHGDGGRAVDDGW